MYFCTFGFESPMFPSLQEFKDVANQWLTNWQEEEPSESIYITTTAMKKCGKNLTGRMAYLMPLL